jgi:murein DD-endopeptidase MepM/ murein hydrolase activator NlpD
LRIRTRPLLVLVAVGLVLAAGCGSGDADGGGGGARAEYAAAQREVRTLGRDVVAQLDAGDTGPVASRFSPELAAQFTPAQLEELVAELRRSGGIGDRTDEGELVLGPDVRSYTAEHEVGDGRWSFEMVFDAEGTIVGGDIRPVGDPLPPDPKAGYRTQTRLRFPLEGEWFVFWGGDTERTNYHVVAPAQRHAYDLVVWRDGGTHRGAGAANDDYWAWGQRIVAPAAGEVVAAVDGVADSQPLTGGVNETDPAGNHVLIDVGHGEYVLLAHFQKGSVAVKAGDRVEAGQLLGLTGSSGNSSEPHLHVHLQDSPVPLEGVGLPLAFSDLTVDGDAVARAELVQGQFVAADGDG